MVSTAEALKNNATETAQAAQDAMRRFADESATLSRAYLNSWTATAQAAMRASFDVQNAGILASRAIVDAAMQANKVWFDQMIESVRKNQDASTRAMNAGIGLVETSLSGWRS